MRRRCPWLSLNCPCQASELLSGRPEIAVRHDVVALEHRARPVAGQLHGHPLRNRTSNHVTDGRPAQVMRDASRASRCDAGGFPGLAEGPDGLRVLLAAARVGHKPEEHPRCNLAGLLEAEVFKVLCFQQSAKVVG